MYVKAIKGSEGDKFVNASDYTDCSGRGRSR